MEYTGTTIDIGDFVLVKVCGKREGALSYYVAEIIEKSEIDYEVKYNL